jgi:8-oxo-dGTP diphosphatase
MTDIKDLTGAIIIQNARILLVHNIKHGRRIENPGGKVEKGESHEQALKRECQEEIGCEIRIGDKMGVYHCHTPEGVFNCHHYHCTITKGEPTITEPHKCDKIEWYSYEDLETLKKDGFLVPNIVEAMEHIKTLMEHK